MSHYTVLAIIRKGSRQTLEELLAPYDENKQVAPYIYKTKAQLIAREAQEIEKHRRSHAAAISLSRDEYFAIADAEDLYHNYDYMQKDLPQEVDSLDLTDEAALFAHIKKMYGDEINEDGDLISTYNPDSKWDWYDVGGRWGGSLALKAGGRANEAKAGDVDWDAMYGKAAWTTYAVVNENGWHAPGEMGWFGCSSETDEAQREWNENFRSRFIDTLDPEDTVIVVDCHI